MDEANLMKSMRFEANNLSRSTDWTPVDDVCYIHYYYDTFSLGECEKRDELG